jgi:hypothetical protein
MGVGRRRVVEYASGRAGPSPFILLIHLIYKSGRVHFSPSLPISRVPHSSNPPLCPAPGILLSRSGFASSEEKKYFKHKIPFNWEYNLFVFKHLPIHPDFPVRREPKLFALFQILDFSGGIPGPWRMLHGIFWIVKILNPEKICILQLSGVILVYIFVRHFKRFYYHKNPNNAM